MQTEQVTFNDPIKFMEDLNRRVLSLEDDMHEMDAVFEVIFGYMFTKLGVKPNEIQDAIDRVKLKHEEMRKEMAKVLAEAEKASKVEHPLDGQLTLNI